MQKPEIDEFEAMDQAGYTIEKYLSQAIEEIDKQLGGGYAKAHPELLAGCVVAQTQDDNNTSITKVLYAISEELSAISGSMHDVAYAIGMRNS